MRIGLVLPSILVMNRFSQRIFAPLDLFNNLLREFSKTNHEIFLYHPYKLGFDNVHERIISTSFNNTTYQSIRDVDEPQAVLDEVRLIRTSIEYELDFMSKTLQAAKADSLDILHVYLSYYSLYLLQNSSIRSVVTLHDPVFEKDVVERIRLQSIDKVMHIAISNRQKEICQSRLPTKIVDVIYHGIDTKQWQYFDKSEDYMIFIGRYLPFKGTEAAIKLALSHKKKLVLATSANYQKNSYYQNTLKKYFPNDLLHENTKMISIKEKNQIMGKAKVLLFPVMWEEPFGMVLIEAMASGTPVIAYTHGAVPEIIVDGKTGFLVNSQIGTHPHTNTIIKKTGFEGLHEAVEKIYALSESEYQLMRKNCREHVEKYFTFQRMAENHLKTYEKIIRQYGLHR